MKCESCKNKNYCIGYGKKPCCGAYTLEKKLTHGDKIRSMSDEELSEFLDNIFNRIGVQEYFPCNECTEKVNCDVCLLEWLQSEAESEKF